MGEEYIVQVERVPATSKELRELVDKGGRELALLLAPLPLLLGLGLSLLLLLRTPEVIEVLRRHSRSLTLHTRVGADTQLRIRV
jgi:hypothetical protein